MSRQYTKVMYRLMDRLEAFTLRRQVAVPEFQAEHCDVHLG